MMTVRRTGTASAATLSVLVSVLATVHTLAPDWSRKLGLDVWNFTALLEQKRRSDAEQARLEAACEQTARRIEACGHIVTRLVEGRTTLSQAAEELQPLLATVPGFETNVLLHYQAPTMRHGAARYAIHRAAQILHLDPTRKAEVLRRLEAEYAALE
jgi:hypothetical protein